MSDLLILTHSKKSFEVEISKFINHHLNQGIELYEISKDFFKNNNSENLKSLKDKIDQRKFSRTLDLTIFDDEKKSLLIETLLTTMTDVCSDFSGNNLSQNDKINSSKINFICLNFNPFLEKIECKMKDRNFLNDFFSKLSFFPISNEHNYFIGPRVFATIINEAHYALSDNLASIIDIDNAMKFGVNYPLGPFEWANKIDLRILINLFKSLTSHTGPDLSLRYKISEEILSKNADFNLH